MEPSETMEGADGPVEVAAHEDNAADADTAIDAAATDATADAVADATATNATETAITAAVQEAVDVSHQVVQHDLEREVQTLTRTQQALQQQITVAHETVATWQQKYTELQATTAASVTLQHAVQQAHDATTTLQMTNATLSDRVERMQTEADVLRAEISRLTASNTALTTQVHEYSISSSLSESSVVPLHHQAIRLQTEVDRWTTHCNWLETELASQHETSRAAAHAARDVQARQQEQVHTLQLQLAQVQAQASAAERHGQSVEAQLEQARLAHRALQTQRADDTREAEQAVASERRLVEAQSEQIVVWQRRYDDVVRQQEQWQVSAQAAVEQGQAEWNDAQQQLETKYQALLTEQAESYQAKLAPYEAVPMNTVMPTVAHVAHQPAVDDEPEVLSMMDLYDQLARTKQALQHETMQHQKYKLLLSRVQTSIAAKSTELIRQRDEHDLAVTKAHDYARRLEKMVAERNEARSDCQAAVAELTTAQRQVAASQGQVTALAQQVQQLLQASVENGDQRVDEIARVQRQNQRLVTEHAELTDTVAELQHRLATEPLVLELQHARKELQGLSNERQTQEQIVSNIVQQRDLYRALLNQRDGATLQGTEPETAVTVAQHQSERASTLQHELDTVQRQLHESRAALDEAVRDKESLSERVARYDTVHADLMNRVTTLETDVIAARGVAARHEADAAYHTTKCEQLTTALERAKSETAQVNAARLELQAINASVQDSISASQTERSKWHSETQAALAKLRLVEAQYSTAKAMEDRLTRDNEQLRVDNTRYGDFVESLQRVEATLSARAVEERDSWQAQLTKATASLELAQTKLAAATDNDAARTAEWQGRLEDVSRQSAKHQADALSAQTTLLQTQTELQTVQGKCTKLEAHLRAAKKKLGLTDISAADDDVEVVLQSKIDALEIELAQARAQLTALEDQVADYKTMAQTSEAALKDVQNTTTNYTNEQETKYNELQVLYENAQKDNSARQAIIRDLTDDLAGQRGEREALEAELKLQISTLEAKLQDQELSVTSAQAQAAALVHDVESWRHEAHAAQNNYERELGVHAQARTALRTAQDTLDEMTHKYQVAEQQLETLRDELEQEKTLLQGEFASAQEAGRLLETSLQESRDQNKVLHSRLESLNSVVEQSQTARIATVTGTDGSDSVDTDSTAATELKELLRFLRTENELLQTQMDTSKRAAEREKSAANVIRRSLEEVRSELKELQTREATVGASVADSHAAAAADVRSRDEQLVLLKDSNKLLRDELDAARSKLSVSLGELSDLQKSVEPTETVQRELGMKIKTLETEKGSLGRELDSWKARMKSLVSSVNQIDPEEHRLLQQQLGEMAKAAETQTVAQKTTEEEIARIRGVAKRVNLQNQEIQKTVEAQKKEIAKLASEKAALASASSARTAAHKEMDELKQKIVKLEKDAESVGKALAGANERNDKLREKLREFQKGLRESRTKEMTLTEELKAAQASVEALKAAQATSTVATVKPTESAISVSNSQSATSQGDTTKPQPEPPVVLVPKLTQSENVIAAEEVLPCAPPGGFLFGPSKGTGQSKSTSTTGSVSTLRVAAASFTPAASVPPANNESKPAPVQGSTTPVKLPIRDTVTGAHSPHLSFPSPDPRSMASTSEIEAASTATAAATTATRRMSGDTKEEEFKKRLLEKKRRLAEQTKFLKRKQQTEAVDQNETADKKAKTDSLPAATMETKSAAPAERQLSSGIVEPQEPLVDSVETTTGGAGNAEEPSDVAAIDVENIDAEVEEQASGKDAKDEPVESLPAESSVTGGPFVSTSTWSAASNTAAPTNPFGAASAPTQNATQGTTFGQSSTLSSPFVTAGAPPSLFGSNAPPAGATQPSVFGASNAFAAPVFGASSISALPPTSVSTAIATAPASTGAFGSGAFLDIKPPSSSSSGAPPPTFTFGTSSSITLPTPTIPANGPTASPFGAFGTFGGGFGAPPASMQARPLFGAAVVAETPAALDEDEVINLADDDEEEVTMQDDEEEGTMDA